METSPVVPSSDPEASMNIVQAYKKIASDPEKRLALASDPAGIQFLVYVFDDSDTNLKLAALQTIETLSKNRECCRLMSKVYGVSEALEVLIESRQESSEIRQLAQEVYTRIVAATNRICTRTLLCASGRIPFQEPGHARPLFLGSANCRAKTLRFHIDGLESKEHRKMCEEELLLVKGIISFTFNMAQQQCILRTRAELLPQSIAEAIQQTGQMTAAQIVRDEFGNEDLVHFPLTSPKPLDLSSLPDYLSEEESPVSHKAVSRFGLSGLKETTSNWLNSAANFISESFYW